MSLFTPTLHYFDCRGLAETTRYMFAIKRTPYEDHRFPFTFGTPGDFTTIQRPEFDDAQTRGEFSAGMDKVPILEVHGTRIAQSKSVERFVAKKLGMFGQGPLEEAQIDMVCEHVRDIKDAYQKVKRTEGEEERKRALDQWFQETLPQYSEKLERALPPCVATCTPLNVGHVTLYNFYTWFFDRKEDALNAILTCNTLRFIQQHVANLPEVQRWEEVRGVSPF